MLVVKVLSNIFIKTLKEGRRVSSVVIITMYTIQIDKYFNPKAIINTNIFDREWFHGHLYHMFLLTQVQGVPLFTRQYFSKVLISSHIHE